MSDDVSLEIMRLAGQGYTCAQIVVILGLRLMGRENPDLIRAMSPLAMGASMGSICGALTGGLCLLGVHLGKGLEFERPEMGGKIPPAALIKWFAQEELQGKTPPTCAGIFEAGGQKLDLESGAPAAACADLVAHAYEKVISLLAEHGLDPTEGRELE
ncbi:MAG: C-GCAxxG-C-C family protein [Deltaproteobacteria bacterium]|jgi:hypothetical protein|nr:C-GCAxxG-C-C family protein [Deltaproteobacteria bacterium]